MIRWLPLIHNQAKVEDSPVSMTFVLGHSVGKIGAIPGEELNRNIKLVKQDSLPLDAKSKCP